MSVTKLKLIVDNIEDVIVLVTKNNMQNYCMGDYYSLASQAPNILVT